MKSERLKAVPQSEFGNLPNFYKSVKENWTTNITHTHTHTHTHTRWWYPNC
jgi:hypothetical protein